MTALLTDEEIFDEAEEFTVNPISTDSFRQGFRLGAEYARSIYEARSERFDRFLAIYTKEDKP